MGPAHLCELNLHWRIVDTNKPRTSRHGDHAVRLPLYFSANAFLGSLGMPGLVARLKC